MRYMMQVVRRKSKAATVASICCKMKERRTERLINSATRHRGGVCLPLTNSDVYQEPPKISPTLRKKKEFI